MSYLADLFLIVLVGRSEASETMSPNRQHLMDVSSQAKIRSVCLERSWPFLFDVFINSLDEDIEIMPVKSAVDTKLGDTANVLESRITYSLSQLCDLASKNANINLGCFRSETS